MKRINYKSDFDFVLRLTDSEGNAIEAKDFGIAGKLWTSSKANAFTFSSGNNKENDNCILENGSIHVVCDGHKLNPGVLNIELTADIPNELYPDGAKRIVVTDKPGIQLVSDNTTDTGSTIVCEVQLPLSESEIPNTPQILNDGGLVWIQGYRIHELYTDGYGKYWAFIDSPESFTATLYFRDFVPCATLENEILSIAMAAAMSDGLDPFDNDYNPTVDCIRYLAEMMPVAQPFAKIWGLIPEKSMEDIYSLIHRVNDLDTLLMGNMGGIFTEKVPLNADLVLMSSNLKNIKTVLFNEGTFLQKVDEIPLWMESFVGYVMRIVPKTFNEYCQKYVEITQSSSSMMSARNSKSGEAGNAIQKVAKAILGRNKLNPHTEAETGIEGGSDITQVQVGNV